MAKRYAHTEGVDLGVTFAPTTRREMFRLVLALAAQHNFHLEQLDAKPVFLQAEIEKEVSKEQPESFAKFAADGIELELVCKLNEFQASQQKTGMIVSKLLFKTKTSSKVKAVNVFMLNVRTVVRQTFQYM